MPIAFYDGTYLPLRSVIWVSQLASWSRLYHISSPRLHDLILSLYAEIVWQNHAINGCVQRLRLSPQVIESPLPTLALPFFLEPGGLQAGTGRVKSL